MSAGPDVATAAPHLPGWRHAFSGKVRDVYTAEADADATREEVLDHAAAAIATAQATRQSVCFADEEGEGGSEMDDIALMRDLRRAIERGELRLHYQPKLRSRTNATSNGLSRPGRTTVRLILVPGTPRIDSTASSSVPP